MNYAAVLSVLAAAAFALPLVVRGLEAFGVNRGLSVALVLIGASLTVAVWAVNARYALRRDRTDDDAGRAPAERAPPARSAAGARAGPALGVPPGGAAGTEGAPLGLREP